RPGLRGAVSDRFTRQDREVRRTSVHAGLTCSRTTAPPRTRPRAARRRTTPSRRSRSATAPTRARDSAVPRRCVAVPSSPCSPVLEPEIPQVLTHPRRGGCASLLPPFALPHLDAIVGPRDGHLALETCVLAEVLRNRDPALPIRTVFVCSGEDEP